MTTIVYPKIIKGLTNSKSIYRWNYGIRARLPNHYRERMIQHQRAHETGDTTPVHYIPESGYWKPGPFKDTILPVQNRPIPVIFPEEADKGLWAGEGIVKGLHKKDTPFARRNPKIWMPNLKEVVLYSEILDLHMKITVTERALQLIEDVFGLDYYILKTPEVDLNSNLAMKLKQKMQTVLLDKSMYPNDPEKNERVYNKYKAYITYSREELEWLGLSEEEAIEKQKAIEAVMAKPRPLKDVFTEELLQRLELGENPALDEDYSAPLEETEDTTKPSLLSRFNVFRKKSS